MPSSNIYLGSNQILEAQGSRRMYLGGQLICKAYFGSTLVFDNCAAANSNVELSITNNISGPSAGYTIGGNLAGFTKSGQPTTSYTAFSTTVSVNSGYTFSSGPSVSNAPGGTFPSPGGTTTIVTTTLSGTVAANTPTYSDTITVVRNNTTITTGTAGGSGSYGPFAAGTSYNVPVTFTPNANYTYALTATDGSSTISLSLNSSSGNYEGTLSRTMGTGANVTITINGTQTANQTAHEFQFTTTSLLNATATYNVANTSTTTSGNAPANITVTEPYGTSLTPNLTVTTNSGYTPAGTFTSSNPGVYTFSASNNQAIQVGVTSSPTVVNVSGTATIAYTAVTFYTATGSCANDSCINYASGGTATLYYGSSGPGSGLFTNTGLTNQNTQYAGYHARTTGGSIFINTGGGTGALQSCVSGSLTQFSNTTFNTTKISACSGYLSDTFYGNGGLLTTSTVLYNGNTGCTGVGVGWVSDGNDAVQVSAGGNVIQYQSC